MRGLLDQIFEGRDDERREKEAAVAKDARKPGNKKPGDTQTTGVSEVAKSEPNATAGRKVAFAVIPEGMRRSETGYLIGRKPVNPLLGRHARAFPWAELEIGEFFFLPGAKKVSGISHWAKQLNRGFKSRTDQLEIDGKLVDGLSVFRTR